MHYYEVALLTSPLSPLTYNYSSELQISQIVHVTLRGKTQRSVILSCVLKPEFVTQEIVEVSDFYYSIKQMKLAQFISSYYFASLGEALGIMTAFRREILNQVQDDEREVQDDECVVQDDEREVQDDECVVQDDECVVQDDECEVQDEHFIRHSELDSESKFTASKLKLSHKQEKALAFVKEHKISLLFGDTGSGKTEIYMKYFEHMIAQDKRSLFLMPEISLTPQMSKRLEEHFAESVVMWHSKLTPLQKKKAMAKIYNGEAKIIAGPRSALFLPIENLGLIVVDEEHDDSYKSSSRPRYNARDIAIYMGKIHDVPVVLGSATPSLSSYVKFPHVRLKGGHYLSNKEFIYEKSAETLSPLILQNLKFTLEKKEQSIVFLPTRANFKYLICGDCGHTYECVFCSIGMSIHQKSHALKCHYCNYTQAIPQKCSECGSSHLTSSRLGTAEAVKNIAEELSNARVEQFDRDVITTSAKLKKALTRFNENETDILVGTQMLSKGHDYHGVTLAVVLGMDNMLNMSDYRAREKALAALIQVAGRSGRAKDAKVIIQSFNEDFFSRYIENYEGFLEEEKRFREALYPPYKKLCRVLFSHKNGIKAQEQMFTMQEKLSRFSNIEIVGYGKCAIERVADKYRFEILLRSDKSTDIIKAIQMCRVDLAEIDMDPIEFG